MNTNGGIWKVHFDYSWLLCCVCTMQCIVNQADMSCMSGQYQRVWQRFQWHTLISVVTVLLIFSIFYVNVARVLFGTTNECLSVVSLHCILHHERISDTKFVERFCFTWIIRSTSNGHLSVQINNFQWRDTLNSHGDEGSSRYDILRIEAARSSESCVSYHVTTRCPNSEDQGWVFSDVWVSIVRSPWAD
jgi:hypothetical protein